MSDTLQSDDGAQADKTEDDQPVEYNDHRGAILMIAGFYILLGMLIAAELLR